MSLLACDQQHRQQSATGNGLHPTAHAVRGNQHTSSGENTFALTNAKEKTMSSDIETTEEPSILTVDQAARYLCVPKATLYTWRTRRAGFGPRALKFGGCLRYRRSDLDAWVAEHVESLDGHPVASSLTDSGESLSRASAPR